MLFFLQQICSLKHRGKLDNTQELVQFGEQLEKACIDTVESGKMTKDLALCVHGKNMKREHWLTTGDYLNAVVERLHSVRK